MDQRQLEYAAFVANDRATEVSRTSPDHGPRHWRDVGRIAHLIAPEDANYPLIFLFAAIHDTQREDEYDDPMHGERSTALARHLRATKVIQMEDEEFRLLQYALRDHDQGNVCPGDVSVATCWDADRLTLIRVGHRLDPRYFSHAKVREDLAGYKHAAADVIIGPDMRWGHIAALYAERMRVATH